MPFRIELSFKDYRNDALGNSVRNRIERELGIKFGKISTSDVFTIDAVLGRAEIEAVAKEFADPIIQNYSIDFPSANKEKFDFAAEIGFRSGVTDNVGKTAKEAIEFVVGRKLKEEEAVYYSTQFLFFGSKEKKIIEQACEKLLYNVLIQQCRILSKKEFLQENGFSAIVPKVKQAPNNAVAEINLNVSDSELERISREGILALSLQEMKAIQAYYKNPEVQEQRKEKGMPLNPTDAELEAIAQTWSEHCKHKIFNAIVKYTDGETGKTERIDSLFKTYIVGATKKISEKKDWLLSVFHDNSGVIKFNDDWAVCFKVETHNSPSALDPYGGALTGIVGCNRDPLGTGKGAKLIFNTDVFCFGNPFWEKQLPEKIMHPRRIFEGVRRGVEHGGNKSGIPTVNGAIVFDDRYMGKPLVYCGTGGLMPLKANGFFCYEKQAEQNDLIVMVGGKIGKDGIHGATFSSMEMNENSPVTAVQIGDPITQKKMSDMLLEARDQNLFNSITDNGAGGLSCSVGEMAKESNGFEMELKNAPLKYPGLAPWEILLSEAQERMTVSVQENKLEKFLELCRKHEVEASVLGRFIDNKKFSVTFEGKQVAFLDLDFLHDGYPRMVLEAEWAAPKTSEPILEEKKDYGAEMKQLLERPNICSKEYVVRQYDHEVQGSSIIKPLSGAFNDGPSDAGVLKPLPGSWEGLVISNGICPRYSDIDAYYMTANAVDEAIRNAVASGCNPDYIALLDNFCWPDPVFEEERNPDGKYKMAQLVRSCKALLETCLGFSAPLVSGKDSMKNDYKIGKTKISVPPTLLVSALGKIEDVRNAVTIDAKQAGDIVFVLGLTKNELGGSEYYAINGLIGKNVPVVDAKKALETYKAFFSAVQSGIVQSCHDVSDGGLAVALAETAFSGDLGMKIDLSRLKTAGVSKNFHALFSESPSRLVVTVKKENAKKFERLFAGKTISCLGKITEEKNFVVFGIDGKQVINEKICVLKEHWQKTLKW